MPTLRIGGMSAIVLLLYMAAVFGSLHLLAVSTPDAMLSKAWLALGF